MYEHPKIIELRDLGASIGENVFLGPDVYIESEFAPLLTIEDGVVLARGVSILLHDSALNNVLGEPIRFGRVILRRGCYIGANTTLLCGVEVGARAIIGACSLVTMDVPPEAVVYGQPARIHGNVHELADKHRNLRAKGGKYHYLDLMPWRERRGRTATESAVRQIEAFLHQIKATDSHSQ